MENLDMPTLVMIGGAITTGAMSLVKRFNPDLSNFWKGVIVLLISLLTVWGYEIYSLGFDKLMSEPWETILTALAVTGTAVSLYQVLLKPVTISPRIEGTFTPEKK